MSSSLSNARCHASVEASVNLLQVSLGRLCIPAETSLYRLLSLCFVRFKEIFALQDSHNVLSLERMLDAIFDTSSRPFVTEASQQIMAALDDHDKSSLYLQGVVGTILIFERLAAAGSGLLPNIFARELQLFSESEQRSRVLNKISSSHIFSSSYTRDSIVKFLAAALEDREEGHHDKLPLGSAGEDLLSDSVAWVSDRPCKNMGLPWGFTIMALN